MRTSKTYLTSAVLAAALGLALGLMSAPAEAHCARKHTGDHPHCTPDDPITYTAKLTMGAFEFMCFDPDGPFSDPVLCALNTVEVTPNNREIELRSNQALDMVRPDVILENELYLTWNEVFNACAELLGGMDLVADFFVASDDWSIHKAGGVRVVFRDIELQGIDLQGAEVRVQLIGEEFDFIVPFLPAPGNTSVFDLVDFAITGTPVTGKGAIKSCRGSAGGGELTVLSTLEITASAP